MKTKYILHGGAAQKINSKNDEFFKEILKDAPDNPRILLVHFACKERNRHVNKKKDIVQFERSRGDKNITYDVANEKTFPKQVQEADVVYFGGGTTSRLLGVLKKFGNLNKLFIGKIIAGESAGANCLSAYCYSKSGGGVLRGIGLVPVKIIPHYQIGDDEKLKDAPKELETLLLSNYQFQVFII